MNSRVGKWGYEFEEQNFEGTFDTEAEAVSAAVKALTGVIDDGDTFHVGMYSSPQPPEHCIDADDVIERIHDHEDYNHEFAEWPNASKEQMAELTAELENVLAGWYDRHKLRPHWYLVRGEDQHEYAIVSGKAVQIGAPA